jgi:hypothetical protein
MEDLVQVVKSQLKEKNLQGMLEVYNIQESSLSSSEDDEESSILERSDLWLVKCDKQGWTTVDIEASIKTRNYSFFMFVFTRDPLKQINHCEFGWFFGSLKLGMNVKSLICITKTI